VIVMPVCVTGGVIVQICTMKGMLLVFELRPDTAKCVVFTSAEGCRELLRAHCPMSNPVCLSKAAVWHLHLLTTTNLSPSPTQFRRIDRVSRDAMDGKWSRVMHVLLCEPCKRCQHSDNQTKSQLSLRSISFV